MNVVKKSITLPKALDAYVARRARRAARARGRTTLNFSEALAELIIQAKQQEDAAAKALAA